MTYDGKDTTGTDGCVVGFGGREGVGRRRGEWGVRGEWPKHAWVNVRAVVGREKKQAENKTGRLMSRQEGGGGGGGKRRDQ